MASLAMTVVALLMLATAMATLAWTMVTMFMLTTAMAAVGSTMVHILLLESLTSWPPYILKTAGCDMENSGRNQDETRMNSGR